jgi:DNA-binding response OmpR family regulator
MSVKHKILLIEDDQDLVAAIATMLRSRGYETTAASDPEQGMQKLAQFEPDLIILDVMFGNSGESKGFDFATKIRTDKNFSGVPILMLTAINSIKPLFNFSPDTDGEYLPVDAFLDKPVRAEELFRNVEELIQRKTSKWKNWPEKE